MTDDAQSIADAFRGRPGDDTVHDRDRRLRSAIAEAMRGRAETVDPRGLKFSHGREDDGLVVRVFIPSSANGRTERLVVPDSAVERLGERGAVDRAVRAAADQWPEFEPDRGGAPPVGSRDFSSASARGPVGADERDGGDEFPELPDDGEGGES